MGIKLSTRNLSIRLGANQANQVSSSKFVNEWLEGIANAASTEATAAIDRKVDPRKLQDQMSVGILRIIREADHIITQRILGKISSTIPYHHGSKQEFSSTGFTTFSLNSSDFNAALGPRPPDGSRRSRASVAFSNRGLSNPWLNGSPPATTVRWQNLQHRTWQKKRKSGLGPVNAAKFFIHSQALARELRADKTGPQRVLVRVTSQSHLRQRRNLKGQFIAGKVAYLPETLILKDLQIKLLPTAPRAATRALLTGNWDDSMALEQWLGISQETRQKLRGPKNVKTRHLIQPVLSYYLRREAPRAISYAIRRAALT